MLYSWALLGGNEDKSPVWCNKNFSFGKISVLSVVILIRMTKATSVWISDFQVQQISRSGFDFIGCIETMGCMNLESWMRSVEDDINDEMIEVKAKD